MRLSADQRPAVADARRAVLAVSLVVHSSCGLLTDPGPTPLMSPLRSRMSMAAVKAALGVEDARWDARSERSARKGRPAFEVTEVSIASFSDLGVKGRWLSLTFFNDQLMTTDFSPEDFDRYRARLAADRQIRFGTANEAYLPPGTRVWFRETLGPNSPAYVTWEDQALTEEYRTAVTG